MPVDPEHFSFRERLFDKIGRFWNRKNPKLSDRDGKNCDRNSVLPIA